MTAESSTTESPEVDAAGASFHAVSDWHAIDWHIGQSERTSASSTYREGDEGKEMGQGQSRATTLNPLGRAAKLLLCDE
jgi:hypothetical protein